jgi:hypothetical protein
MFVVYITEREQRRYGQDNAREHEDERGAAAHEQTRYDGNNNAGYTDNAYHIGGTRFKRQAVREYIPVY